MNIIKKNSFLHVTLTVPNFIIFRPRNFRIKGRYKAFASRINTEIVWITNYVQRQS